MLFSGMIEGISAILREAVRQGETKEIRLAKGLLILSQDPKLSLVFVLVTTKNASILHEALNEFAASFANFYREDLNLNGDINYAEFKQAEQLIHEHFSFLPSPK